MKKEQQKEIIDFIINLEHSKWISLDRFTPEERKFIIHIIQNQKGCSLEADGVSYQEDTHTRFRKLNINNFTFYNN